MVCDETQFYTPAQVDDLARLVDELDIDVFAVGILTDFQTHLFPGSRRLVELCDSMEVLQVEALCWCGRRATHNARTVDGLMVRRGRPGRRRRHRRPRRVRPTRGGAVAYEVLCRRHHRSRDDARWSRTPGWPRRCPSARDGGGTHEHRPGRHRPRRGCWWKPEALAARPRAGCSGSRCSTCAGSMTGPPGRPEHEAGHLPGAVFVDLETELSGAHGQGGGRHPLPDPEAFQAAMRAAGVDDDVPVVAYDGATSLYAARLWWLLTDAGHARRPGARRRVRRLGRGAGSRSRPGRYATATRRRVRRATRAARAGSDVGPDPRRPDARTLVDVRAGQALPRRGRAASTRSPGTSPGRSTGRRPSCSTSGSRFRPGAEVAAAFAGVEAPVLYCGSGITAAQALLALEASGIEGGRIYPGSWSDWISDPAPSGGDGRGARRRLTRRPATGRRGQPGFGPPNMISSQLGTDARLRRPGLRDAPGLGISGSPASSLGGAWPSPGVASSGGSAARPRPSDERPGRRPRRSPGSSARPRPRRARAVGVVGSASRPVGLGPGLGRDDDRRPAARTRARRPPGTARGVGQPGVHARRVLGVAAEHVVEGVERGAGLVLGRRRRGLVGLDLDRRRSSTSTVSRVRCRTTAMVGSAASSRRATSVGSSSARVALRSTPVAASRDASAVGARRLSGSSADELGELLGAELGRRHHLQDGAQLLARSPGRISRVSAASAASSSSALRSGVVGVRGRARGSPGRGRARRRGRPTAATGEGRLAGEPAGLVVLGHREAALRRRSGTRRGAARPAARSRRSAATGESPLFHASQRDVVGVDALGRAGARRPRTRSGRWPEASPRRRTDEPSAVRARCSRSASTGAAKRSMRSASMPGAGDHVLQRLTRADAGLDVAGAERGVHGRLPTSGRASYGGWRGRVGRPRPTVPGPGPVGAPSGTGSSGSRATVSSSPSSVTRTTDVPSAVGPTSRAVRIARGGSLQSALRRPTYRPRGRTPVRRTPTRRHRPGSGQAAR